MKKTVLFMLFVAVMCGCAKEVSIDRKYTKEFKAGSEILSRTTLKDSSVLWSADDRIGVFAATGLATPFSVKSLSDDKASAVFTGTIGEADTYYAVYPYSEEFSLAAGGKIMASIPSVQTFTDSSFSGGANLAVAIAADNAFAFKNVGAILSLTVTAPDIKSIKLESDAVMAGGNATIDYNGGDPQIVSVEDGSSSITMNGDFVSGKPYFFVVYPGSYSWFQLTFTTSEGKTTTLRNNTAKVIARRDNINLGKMDFTPVISVKGSNTYSGGSITFTTPDLGEGAQYSWAFEGGTPATSTDRTVEVTYAASGKFDVTLTVNSGARSGSVVKDDMIRVYPGTPLLFLPFDGDYDDHGPQGIKVDRIDSAEATEFVNFQPGRPGTVGYSAYIPGFNTTRNSFLSITDEKLGNLFNSNENFTISFFFRARSNKSGTEYFFSQGTGAIATGWHYLRLDNMVAGAGGKFRLFYQIRYTNSVNDDKSISKKYNYPQTQLDIDLKDNKWHHIVVRSMVTGTAPDKKMNWRMFVDGNGPFNNDNQEVKTLDSYIPFLIGAMYSPSEEKYLNPYQGQFDDFIVWNTAVSDEDLATLNTY